MELAFRAVLWTNRSPSFLRIMRGTALVSSHLAEFCYRSLHKPMFPAILDDIERYLKKMIFA